MQIDLHSFTLKEAKEIINLKIKECYRNNDYTLTIIHGFKNGTKIKDYLKNSKKLRLDNPEISEILPDLLNSGKSIIKLKIKSYWLFERNFLNKSSPLSKKFGSRFIFFASSILSITWSFAKVW